MRFGMCIDLQTGMRASQRKFTVSVICQECISRDKAVASLGCIERLELLDEHSMISVTKTHDLGSATFVFALSIQKAGV